MTNDKKLTVGVIGTGRAGRRRMKGIMADPRVSLSWICDSDVRNLDEAVRNADPSVEFSTFPLKLLDAKPVDILFISTPPGPHEELATAAMAADVRHILIEKPISSTPAAAMRLVRAADRRGVHLKVGSNTRHFAEINDLLRLAATGRIGDVSEFVFSIGHRGNNLPAWAFDPVVAGGGTLLDNGVHVIDLALLLGLIPRPCSIEAEVEWDRPGIDNHATWRMSGEKTRGEFIASWKRTDDIYLSARIAGSGGTLTLVIGAPESSLAFEAESGSFLNRYDQPADSWGEDTLHFIDCATSGGAAGATGYDGARAVAIVDQVYLAARLGGTIEAEIP